MTQTQHDPSSNAQIQWARGDDADQLVSRGQASDGVFVSSAWVRAAWRHLPELGSPLVLTVGIGPDVWWLPMAERPGELFLAGAPFGDRHDLVGPAGPARARASSIMTDALCDQQTDVHLHGIEPHSALAAALGRGQRWTVQPEPSPLIPTTPRSSRGPARRLRRVERLGLTRIAIEHGEELDAARVRAFAAGRREVWRARGRELPPLERLDGFDGFLAEAVPRLARDDRARLWELWVGEALVAQDLHLGRPERPLLYMRAYDPAWAALSPGRVLLEQTLRILHGRGVGVLDSGRGDEPYKAAQGGDAMVVLNASSVAPERSSRGP